MLSIKRLYTYILQGFILQLMATFVICLFILLMQFLWRYVDEMIGKGLEISVLAEFLIYSAISLIPTALPLSILLASLMTFGNMGENLELLAIKAAGVSLLHTMRPLIVFILFISVSSFLFQDYVIPKVQVKMLTLLISIRQKSPELQIPEGSFYQEIRDMSLYVRKKDKKNGLLKDVMIYNFSDGFDNASIILADSARMQMTEDKLFLLLKLYSGEQFENLEKQNRTSQNVPYRRETFNTKDILIAFDANFNRMDEGVLQNQHQAKRLNELQQTIDSLQYEIDSLKLNDSQKLLYKERRGLPLQKGETTAKEEKVTIASFNADSVFHKRSQIEKINIIEWATDRIQQYKIDAQANVDNIEDRAKTLRRHNIEWHKKFSLSFACLIFFFIGAPLGAIIRKGGLGVPVIASVLLFITYYIFDNIGYKMGKNGIWEVWKGSWFSPALLSPLGLFLTYKATKDSAILNADAYINTFKRIFSIKEKTRLYIKKELVLKEPDYADIQKQFMSLILLCNTLIAKAEKRPSYFSFWNNKSILPIEEVSISLERCIDDLKESQDNLIIHKLSDYPVLSHEANNTPIQNKIIRFIFMLFFPIGLLFYFRSLKKRHKLILELKTIIRLNNELSEITKKYIL